jgi:hypothetical protein
LGHDVAEGGEPERDESHRLPDARAPMVAEELDHVVPELAAQV